MDHKYEEALERARKGMPIDEIFPELKESEDERIRTRLIALVEAFGQGKYKNEMLAYLEKQKEQKFIDYPHVPGWRKNRDGNKPELKHSVLMLTTHGVAEGEWLGEKWYQYRWSCKLKDNEILYWIHLSDLTQLEKEDEIIEKEQKPAEWSEEDEQWLESIIKDYDDSLVKDKDHAAIIEIKIDFLKSLRPQPHWKPSEEQMEALKLACEDAFDCPEGGVPHLPLQSLYQDLQKLL